MWVVRKKDAGKNKKWPSEFSDVPLHVEEVVDGRFHFFNPKLQNEKGWVASRFVEVKHDPLERFA